MAWNTEETKRKLKVAAIEEFAAHGPDGTTMSQIGRRAGINKERLYNYFGSKSDLFALVLADELNRLAAAVPIDRIDGPDDVGDYAAAVYEYHCAHPNLSRLLIWEGLAGLPTVPDEASRTAYYAHKADAFRAAQARGVIDDTIPAESLTFLVIAMAGWWHAVPQMARMLHPNGAADPREAVRAAASKLADA